MSYEIKKVVDVLNSIDSSMIEKEYQLSYNYAIVTELRNKHKILSPTRGDMCLYFTNGSYLDEMIINNSFPDIPMSSKSIFRIFRNEFKEIDKNEMMLLDAFAKKIDINFNDLENGRNFDSISVKIDKALKEDWDNTFLLTGIYLRYLSKKEKKLHWEVQIQYEGFNPNWIPYPKNEYGQTIAFWILLDKALLKGKIDISKFLSNLK